MALPPFDSSGNSHTLLWLISTPRSCSTAFERMIKKRGDFDVFHEISTRAFVDGHFGEERYRHFYREDAPETFEDVKKCVFSAQEKMNVFVKDLSCCLKEFIVNDSELLENSSVRFVFLLRNPHHSIISQHRFFKKVIPEFSLFLGYESLFELFRAVKEKGVNPPIVIHSEDLYKTPREAVETFCSEAKIPFKEDALNWTAHNDDFPYQQEWKVLCASKELLWRAHGEAVRSTEFRPPTQYEVDGNGKPTFNEITDAEERKKCFEIYNNALGYYNGIRSMVESSLSSRA